MSDAAPKTSLTRADELVNTGVRFFKENQLDPARLHFLAALSLDPIHPIAWQNLTSVLRNKFHYAAAVAAGRRAVLLTKGENPYCLTNLGVSLFGYRKFEEALDILRRVTEAIPNEGQGWHNYGLVLYCLGRREEALAAFEKALPLALSDPNISNDLALTQLSLGRIAEGLANYESRWLTLTKSRVWKLRIPEWQGEDLQGAKILVHHEQGFGDSLMLSRFLLPLARRGCHITLAVPEPLTRLFRWSFPFITVRDINDVEHVNEDSGFDFHSPLLSVMRHLGISRPADISSAPYLISKGEFSMALPKNKKKIGICWASGDHAPSMRDRRRLVPLEQFLPLLEDPEIALISLQVGKDTKDIVNLGLEGLVFDPSGRIEDFADTARIVKSLDLVISVDSAVAHLAGALGKKCLMLSPHTRCWRWWSLPKGTPWYDRMIAFSQAQDGSWTEATHAANERAKWILKDI